MTYNKAGGILKKDALATGIMNTPDLNYTLNYNYSTNNPHQLEDVIDANTGAQSYYQYNSSGSIKEIQDPTAGGPQSFFWNEEQWLSGVSNDLGVHHYVYDHKGERVIKSSVMHSSVQINDQNIDDIEYLEPYTLYINPYYVVTELKGGDKVSKHYYMNTQRVATDISINYQVHEPMAGPQQPNARDPKKPSEDTTSVNYNAAFADLQTTLTALGHQKLDVDGLGDQPTLEEYYPELVSKPSQNSTMAAKNAPESTTRVLFWYHPDYLGNVDLVTERDGKTYEFFTYNPWGEEMHQYNANTFGFSSPYRFNSKEKDAETGLHYYGARYYQSKLSVWLSVDPWADKYPHVTPYNFVENNPIMLVDPDGNGPGGPPGLGSNPLYTIAHGFQQYFKAVGREVDKLGVEIKGWVSLNYNVAPGTTATEKVTVKAGTTVEEFFTPTNNKPNAPMPMKVDVKKEEAVETKAGMTVRTPYGPISGQVSQTTDYEGNSSTTATASYGPQGQGVFVETTVDNKAGETTTRGGVRAETETPKVNGWSFGIGAEASGGQN